MHRRGFLHSFSLSQIAAITATVVDFALLFALTELLHVWYVVATALGAVAGAVVNFWINRQWSFAATHAGWHGQALRYSLVSAASALLNAGGTWLVTEQGHIHYAVSVVAVSLFVGVVFNFPLHRYYVFR